MKTMNYLVKAQWCSFLVTKKTFVIAVCMATLISATIAQGPEVYDIISTTGSIIDKRSGKPLQPGDKVSFQTDLEFGSLQDRAVLLNSEKSKYFLELPRETVLSGQRTIASNLALMPVKGRPALITGTRGNSVLVTNGLSPQSLREYFNIDTFTIVGPQLKLPVTAQDARKFDLILRYEIGDDIEEYVSSDLTIVKNDLKIFGAGIHECFVLLREGNKEIPVTQLSLFFVEKEQLFGEFDSLLKALNHKKADNNTVREVLRQYCTDVYGMIDRSSLDSTINDFLAL